MPAQRAFNVPITVKHQRDNAETVSYIVQFHSFVRDDTKVRNNSEQINHAMGSSEFGHFFVAATELGICQLEFIDDGDISKSIQRLKQIWPCAKVANQAPQQLTIVESIFNGQQPSEKHLSFHVMATEFQLQVWQALLGIASGSVSTYTDVAKSVGHTAATRAVATAIGANPIAFFIPCHRVIRKDGTLGGYRWGIKRKQAILNWETLH